MKDRPSRQAWEQAPDFFKWTCGDYADVLQARALPTFQERLTAAEAIKEDGNQRFVEDKLDDALSKCAPRNVPPCSAPVATSKI